MVKKRDHVFISGSNGCGKSTLMKIIAGSEKQDSGQVNYGYNVKIGYYDQENQQLDPNNTVIDELWNCYGRLTQTEIRKALAVFLFKGEDVTKKVSVLSGGEKARLTLAKLIISPINLLILDEPTNHLDINSREALENALLQFDGTIIAVSHDRYFINKLANRIFAFNVPENGMIYDYHGTFEEYLAYKKNYLTQESVVESSKKSSSKQDFLDSKKSAAEQRKKKNRLKQLSELIEAAEAELDRISVEINGEAATDYVRLAELYDREEQLETQLLEWYGEQEELSSK
jgi:ATP-binding cassette subfamily F protein 3